jgi:hypothetical protein
MKAFSNIMKPLYIAILMAFAISCTKPEPITPAGAPLTSHKTARTVVDTSFSPALSIAVTFNAVVTSGTLDVVYLSADSTILHSDRYFVGNHGMGYTVYQVKPCTRFIMKVNGVGDIKSYKLLFQ